MTDRTRTDRGWFPRRRRRRRDGQTAAYGRTVTTSSSSAGGGSAAFTSGGSGASLTSGEGWAREHARGMGASRPIRPRSALTRGPSNESPRGAGAPQRNRPGPMTDPYGRGNARLRSARRPAGPSFTTTLGAPAGRGTPTPTPTGARRLIWPRLFRSTERSDRGSPSRPFASTRGRPWKVTRRRCQRVMRMSRATTARLRMRWRSGGRRGRRCRGPRPRRLGGG